MTKFEPAQWRDARDHVGVRLLITAPSMSPVPSGGQNTQPKLVILKPLIKEAACGKPMDLEHNSEHGLEISASAVQIYVHNGIKRPYTPADCC
jgi:hypothetical protein